MDGSEVGAGICVHAQVAVQGKLGRVAVLADDVKGVPIFVHCVGIDDEAASKSAMDGELEVSWDHPVLVNGSDGPEEILELTGVYWFPEELNVSKRDWNEGGKQNRPRSMVLRSNAQNSRASPHRPRMSRV